MNLPAYCRYSQPRSLEYHVTTIRARPAVCAKDGVR